MTKCIPCFLNFPELISIVTNSENDHYVQKVAKKHMYVFVCICMCLSVIFSKFSQENIHRQSSDLAFGGLLLLFVQT